MTHQAMSKLYTEHVEELQRRSALALERGGFDHLVVPSGSTHYQLFDDRDYPYAVNPQFKAWAPLVSNPGSWLVHTPGEKPKLVYLQPFDYWHVVPQAPSGYWVEHFDVVVIREPGEALEHLPADRRAARSSASRRARWTTVQGGRSCRTTRRRWSTTWRSTARSRRRTRSG